jgi:hypothetical protein
LDLPKANQRPFVVMALGKGGFLFKPKKNLAPLQAADMFAWLTIENKIDSGG